MMIRFYGRSSETHKIKNKPISLGYKFFVIATIIRFIINFTPNGHCAEKQDMKNMNEVIMVKLKE